MTLAFADNPSSVTLMSAGFGKLYLRGALKFTNAGSVLPDT